MKTRIISILCGSFCVANLYAVPPVSMGAPVQSNPAVVANSQVVVGSNTVQGTPQMSMVVVSSTTVSPLVKITLSAPATLTVYDQNHNVAFTKTLQPGVTTVDTTNFPLGQNKLVLTSTQTGSTFEMVQNINVQGPAEGNF